MFFTNTRALHQNLFRLLSLFFIFFLTTGKSQAATVHPAQTFDQVIHLIKELTSEFSQPASRQTLVAWDLDETLFLVQDCLNQGPPKKFIEMKRRIFNCETLLTHPEVPVLIQSLQQKGFTNIGLTARRETLIRPTQRELGRWDIDFMRSPHHILARHFSLPLPATRISRNRNLVFEKGVIYSHGHAKGEALEMFKDQVGYHWKQVIFVEDAHSNVKNMHTHWLAHPEVKVHIIHYTEHVAGHFNPDAKADHPNGTSSLTHPNQCGGIHRK